MADEFSDFLADPTGATFLRLRERLLDSPGYDFHSGALDELEELINGGQYDAVPDKISELMPGWLLSPRVHQLAGHAAQETGDPARAAREGYLAKACLRGLLQSGDGSRARPYRVTHVADEYDVLDYLAKEVAEQRVVEGDGGAFDVIGCADGSQLWFDISAGLAGR
jgi:hypothetical protein